MIEEIGYFTVMDGSEGEGDLVLIQTFFALLWKSFLKNTSKHKINLIFIIKQEAVRIPKFKDRANWSRATF